MTVKPRTTLTVFQRLPGSARRFIDTATGEEISNNEKLRRARRFSNSFNEKRAQFEATLVANNGLRGMLCRV
jgi:hypothetical protein